MTAAARQGWAQREIRRTRQKGYPVHPQDAKLMREGIRAFHEMRDERDELRQVHGAIREEMYLWGLGEQDAEATVDAIGKALRAVDARAAQEDA